jgi:hypothetical protein
MQTPRSCLARPIPPFGRAWTLPIVLALFIGLGVGTGWTARDGDASAAGRPSRAVRTEPTLKSLDDVVATLRRAGLTVEVTDQTVTQPFFAVPATIVRVNGQDLQVFIYGSVAARRADSDQISPDGTQIGTSIISWVAQPHFVAAANVLTLFVSNDEALARQIAAAIKRLAPRERASPAAPPGAGVRTIDEVAAALRAAQLVVEVTDQTVTQPFFTVPARILRVNGQDLQVFVYPNEIARADDFAKIGPDGSMIGATTIVDWVAPPHFAAAANIMTLLVSDDMELAMAIEQAVATLS